MNLCDKTIQMLVMLPNGALLVRNHYVKAMVRKSRRFVLDIMGCLF